MALESDSRQLVQNEVQIEEKLLDSLDHEQENWQVISFCLLLGLAESYWELEEKEKSIQMLFQAESLVMMLPEHQIKSVFFPYSFFQILLTMALRLQIVEKNIKQLGKESINWQYHY